MHIWIQINSDSEQYLPVGHWMFSWTSVCLRVPSMAAVSILGWLPQSAQYMVLIKNPESEHICAKYKTTEKEILKRMIHLPSLWIHYNGIRLVYHAVDEGLGMLA